MSVHLVRHADAVPQSHSDVEADAERWLTDEGRAAAREVGGGLARLGVAPDTVASSPYRRARETADALLDGLGLDRQVRDVDALLPSGEPAAAREALAEIAPAGDVLAVGHKPSMPRIASHLLAGDPGAVDVEMGYAAACTVEIPLAAPRARGRLIRLAPADALRALAP